MERGDSVRPDGERIAAAASRVRFRSALTLTMVIGSLVVAPVAMAHFGVRGFIIAYSSAVVCWPMARRYKLPVVATFIVAIALRCWMLLTPPLLSGDVYRYLSDGATLASGHDPYTVLPSDPRVNHATVPTIYPPHAEILFAVVHQLTAWRLLIIGCDVIVLILLPASEQLAYALLPPAVLEGAWSGHLDLVAGMLILLAWRRRSGAAAALAAGMKVIPLVAVPALWAQSARRRFVLAFLSVLLLPALPFVVAGPVMPGMKAYATRWVFNSPAYDIVRLMVEQLPLVRLWTAIKDPLQLEAISNVVYRHLYADFETRAVLALLAIGLLTRFWRRPAASIGILLLCSPAIHPWYWLSALPLAIDREPRWIPLALCAPFSYLLYAGSSKLIVYGLCYAVPITIAAAAALLRPSATASSGAGLPGAESRPDTAPQTSQW